MERPNSDLNHMLMFNAKPIKSLDFIIVKILDKIPIQKLIRLFYLDS